MDLKEQELSLLADLVKSSRQRTLRVDWVDRDGSKRSTALTPVESGKLTEFAQRLKISRSEVMRQAAHIPVPKRPPAPPATGTPIVKSE